MLQQVDQAVFTTRTNCINCGSASLTELAHGRFMDEPLRGFLDGDPWGENPLPHLQAAEWSFVKCGACSQMFHANILNQEWNERRFVRWMSADAITEFEERLGPPFKRQFGSAVSHVSHIVRIERLTRNIRSEGEAVRLMDFGCGFGKFLEACAHFGFETTGVDRSVGRRSEARIEIIASLDEVKAATKFHAITLFEVLEHLDEPAKILAVLSEYLEPGGLLILETPDCSGVTDIKTRLDYHLIHPLEHINAFTHDTLQSIAERCGYKHFERGPAFVMSDYKSAAKRFARHLAKRDGRSTQLYFRKL